MSEDTGVKTMQSDVNTLLPRLFAHALINITTPRLLNYYQEGTRKRPRMQAE